MAKLASFKIRELLRLSAGAISYAALQLGMGRGLGADRKVTLKIYWDLAGAREEAQAMLALGGKGGFLCLYDFIEVTFEEVAELLAPAQSAGVRFESGQALAVLVTQFAMGQALVRTQALVKPAPKKHTKGCWRIELGDKHFLQSLDTDIGADEKLHILRGLIQLVKHAHELEPSRGRGQLHPGNLLYDRDSGTIRLVDWQTVERFNAQAWQSPWHDEPAPIPKAADIYQLALWVARVLGEENRHWRRFSAAILCSRKPEEIPTIHAFETGFNHTADTVAAKLRPRTLVLLGVVLIALLALGSRLIWISIHHSPKLAELAHLKAEALKSELATKEAIARLRHFCGEKDYQPVRKALVDCIGQLRSRSIHPEFLQSLDWSRPSALYLSQTSSFAIYAGFAFELGEPISSHEFIAEIHATGLLVRDLETQAERRIDFPAHPMSDGRDHEGLFLIYPSDLWEIHAALSNLVGQKINYRTFLAPKISGRILEDSPSLVLARIQASMDYVQDLSALTEERRWYVFWDLEAGQAFKGKLGNLVSDMTRRMGLSATGIELLNRTVDVVLANRTDLLTWLEQEALLTGAHLEISKDGKTLRFFRSGTPL